MELPERVSEKKLWDILYFNIHQAIKNNTLRDNDIKYRYIKMHGKVSEEELYRLESIFNFDYNKDSVRIMRKHIERYEQLLREYNEKQLQVRLNDARVREIEKETLKLKK